jgi:soluble lytic murein transglycosylase-like protein
VILRSNITRWSSVAFAAMLVLPTLAHAAEHITLSNGFEIDCARREPVDGDRIRLFLLPSSANAEASYIDIASAAVVRVETIPDPPIAPEPQAATVVTPTRTDLHAILAHAGAAHHIDADLLASVVKAESGGNAHAVSRTGARGLMQLMPGTASAMGVDDAFQPSQNIAGGTAYLDQLLVRYHDDAALALAAYNAGPGAVDKYHGVPPYRETREYVARVIREFNRRKLHVIQNAKTQLASAIVSPKP